MLPEGWLKLKNKAKNLPYYLYIPTLETLWVHPNLPPNPSSLTEIPDVTLKPPYKKYMDPTTNTLFFVNTTTSEPQWNFPDAAFNVGPSTAQQASSALAQSISGSQESSAVAQTVSSARQSTAVASSAVAQTVSSARQTEALAEPLAVKDSIVQQLRTTQEYINSLLAIIYSPRSSPEDIAKAKESITGIMNDFYHEWGALAEITATIFAIAPKYQDRVLQTHVYEASVEALGYIKLYDSMRKTHVIIDSNGYLVKGIDTVAGRPTPVLPPPPPPPMDLPQPQAAPAPPPAAQVPSSNPVVYTQPSRAIPLPSVNPSSPVAYSGPSSATADIVEELPEEIPQEEELPEEIPQEEELPVYNAPSSATAPPSVAPSRSVAYSGPSSAIAPPSIPSSSSVAYSGPSSATAPPSVAPSRSVAYSGPSSATSPWVPDIPERVVAVPDRVVAIPDRVVAVPDRVVVPDIPETTAAP
jgi:hypothetical protein